MMIDKIYCRVVNIDDVLPLRHKILRQGKPLSSAAFSEDNDSSAAHLAAYLPPRQEPIGVLSLYRQDLILQPTDTVAPDTLTDIGWRLRGMAIEEDCQGANIGSALLNFCFEYTFSQGEKPGIWCNVRLSAIGFYEKNGFYKIGHEFLIEDVGPHYVMINPLPSMRKLNLD